MGNCHTSGSSPPSGAGFSALLCSNAGSWTRSRTPGNFSLRAPSTKAQLKRASARYKDSYAIRRYGILLETRLWTGGSQSVGWESAAQKASPAFRSNHLKPQRANCDICMSAFPRDPLCLQLLLMGFPVKFLSKKRNYMERWLFFSHNHSCSSLFRWIHMRCVFDFLDLTSHGNKNIIPRPTVACMLFCRLMSLWRWTQTVM